MRIGYLSSRLLVAANVIGLLLCLSTSLWIYLTHTNLTPEKTERIFQKNIEEANKIHSLEAFRQVHQSLLLSHKREQEIHYNNVRPILWLCIIAIVIFVLNGFIFWQLIREKSLRIR